MWVCAAFGAEKNQPRFMPFLWDAPFSTPSAVDGTETCATDWALPQASNSPTRNLQGSQAAMLSAQLVGQSVRQLLNQSINHSANWRSILFESQHTREVISARKRHTNTSTKTLVIYGNSYLACKQILGMLKLRQRIYGNSYLAWE